MNVTFLRVKFIHQANIIQMQFCFAAVYTVINYLLMVCTENLLSAALRKVGGEKNVKSPFTFLVTNDYDCLFRPLCFTIWIQLYGKPSVKVAINGVLNGAHYEVPNTIFST